MIERIVKAVSGSERPDPLARLAILAVPFLLALIGWLGAAAFADVKADIAALQNDMTGVALGQAGIVQIIEVTVVDIADHEDRLRALEQWQRFLNNQQPSIP